MSFFYFIKNILRHPIQFTDTCLTEKEARPQFRKYAWILFIVGSYLISFTLSLRKKLNHSAPSYQYLNIAVGGLFALLILYPFYLIMRSIFVRALEFSGSSISKDKAGDIVLYLLAVTVLPMLFFLLLQAALAGYIFPTLVRKQSTLFSIIFFLLLLSSRLLSLGYTYFLYYKITLKTTSINPLKVYIWSMGIALVILYVSVFLISRAALYTFADVRGILPPDMLEKIVKFFTPTLS